MGNGSADRLLEVVFHQSFVEQQLLGYVYHLNHDSSATVEHEILARHLHKYLLIRVVLIA